jgi:hypothetical protein
MPSRAVGRPLLVRFAPCPDTHTRPYGARDPLVLATFDPRGARPRARSSARDRAYALVRRAAERLETASSPDATTQPSPSAETSDGRPQGFEDIVTTLERLEARVADLQDVVAREALRQSERIDELRRAIGAPEDPPQPSAKARRRGL